MSQFAIQLAQDPIGGHQQPIYTSTEQQQQEGDAHDGKADAKDLSTITNGRDVAVADGRYNGRGEEQRLAKAPIYFVRTVLES